MGGGNDVPMGLAVVYRKGFKIHEKTRYDIIQSYLYDIVFHNKFKDNPYYDFRINNDGTYGWVSVTTREDNQRYVKARNQSKNYLEKAINKMERGESYETYQSIPVEGKINGKTRVEITLTDKEPAFH